MSLVNKDRKKALFHIHASPTKGKDFADTQTRVRKELRLRVCE
jgi:hypothetical protein